MNTKTLTHTQLFLTDKIIKRVTEPNGAITPELRYFEYIYAVKSHIYEFARNLNDHDILEMAENVNYLVDGSDDQFERMGSVIALLLLLLNYSDDPVVRKGFKTLTTDISMEILQKI